MKLFQKILSHGLLIGFAAAALALYLYRDVIFPQWFGEQTSRVAVGSATETAEQPAGAAVTPAVQPPGRQPIDSGVEASGEAAKSSGVPTTSELPPMATEPDTEVALAPPEASSDDVPPLASGLESEEIQVQPGAAGGVDLPPMRGGVETGKRAAELPPLVEMTEPEPERRPLPRDAARLGEPRLAAGEVNRPRPSAGGEPAQAVAPQPARLPGGGKTPLVALPADDGLTEDQGSAITWAPPEGELRPQFRPMDESRATASAPVPARQDTAGLQPATEAAGRSAAQYRPEQQPRTLSAPVHPAVGGPGAPVAPAPPQVSAYEQGLAEARQRFWEQDLDGAVVAYEGLSREWPRRAEVWGELGNVNFKLGRWSAAADAYYRAIDLLAEQGDDARARHLLKILYGLDAERASELEGRLR